MLPISENDDNEGAETSKDLCLKDEEMLSSEDEDKDNLETNSMNTSLDAGLKLISSSSTSRSVSDGRYHNKHRCLILCSHGVTIRQRHELVEKRKKIVEK